MQLVYLRISKYLPGLILQYVHCQGGRSVWVARTGSGLCAPRHPCWPRPDSIRIVSSQPRRTLINHLSH